MARATISVQTPTLIADFGQVYLSLQGGTTGTRVIDASNNEMLRLLSVTNSAPASTTGLVIKNTATTGVARLQLDANTATLFAQLVSPTGNCTLNVPGQEIWLQNRLTGQAPLIVETNGVVTTAYGRTTSRTRRSSRTSDTPTWRTSTAPRRSAMTGSTPTKRTGWASWPRTCSMEASRGKRCGAGRSSSLWTTANSPLCCGASSGGVGKQRQEG